MQEPKTWMLGLSIFLMSPSGMLDTFVGPESHAAVGRPAETPQSAALVQSLAGIVCAFAPAPATDAFGARHALLKVRNGPLDVLHALPPVNAFRSCAASTHLFRKYKPAESTISAKTANRKRVDHR